MFCAYIDTIHIRVIFIAFIMLLGCVYLWLVNSSAASGLQLTELERQTQTLEEQYRTLQVAQAELQSLDHLKEVSQAAQMEVSGRAQYIQSETGVAFIE